MHEASTLATPSSRAECGTLATRTAYAAMIGYLRRNASGVTTSRTSGSVTYHGGGWPTGLTDCAMNSSASKQVSSSASRLSPTIGCAFIHILNRRTNESVCTREPAVVRRRSHAHYATGLTRSASFVSSPRYKEGADVDSLWVSNDLVPFSITAGVMLLVLSPTRHRGPRTLGAARPVLCPPRHSRKRVPRRWGIAEPAEEQTVLAIRYLRQRRILFVFLFVVSAMAGLLWPSRADKGFSFGIFVPLLAAMLIAELVATLRPAGGGVRVASLDRRTWRDLVPTWSVVLAGTLVAATLALLTLVVLARSWAEQYAADAPREENRGVLQHANAWSTLGWLVGCVALLVVLVLLALRRPSGPH